MRILLLRLPAFGGKCPPLNLAYLAAYLRLRGHDVATFDFDAEAYLQADANLRKTFWENPDSYSVMLDWQDERKSAPLVSGPLMDAWQQKVLDFAPDIIGFSVYFVTLFPSMELARRLRDRSSAKIVFGGPFCRRANGGARDIVSRGIADAAVIGEGEVTFAELVDMFGSGKARACPGAIVRTDRGIEDGGDRELIADLDSLPFPDFSGFQLRHYSLLPIHSSRGCVNNCAYCLDRAFWKKYRCREPANVVAEIEQQVMTHGMYDFVFLDLLVNGHLGNMEKMCRLLVALQNKLGKELRWMGYASPREMSEDLIDWMKRAGCRELIFGVESGSERVLQRFEKRIDLGVAEKIIKTCCAKDISVTIDWIVGFPGETEEDFEKTVQFSKRIQPCSDHFRPANLFFLNPGSRVWNNPRRYGIAGVNPEDLTAWEDDTASASRETRIRRHSSFNAFWADYYRHRHQNQ